MEHDRDSLRFLWLENYRDINSKVIVFRFCRLPFGLNCSPFLLRGTLEHHLKQEELVDPEFVYKVLKSLYVDDLYELYEKTKSFIC